MRGNETGRKTREGGEGGRTMEKIVKKIMETKERVKEEANDGLDRKRTRDEAKMKKSQRERDGCCLQTPDRHLWLHIQLY